MPAEDSRNAYVSLDMQRTATRVEVCLVAALLPVLAAIVAASAIWWELQLPAVPGLLFAYPISLMIVTGLTAYLLYGHADATGVRGYNLLAGGYLFIALILAVQSLFSSVLVFTSGEFLDNGQAYAWLGVLWRLAFPATLIIASLLFMADRRTRRPAGLGLPVLGSVVVVILGAGALAAATLVPDLLPPLVQVPFTGAGTPLAQYLDWAQVALAVLAVVSSGVNARQRSTMSLGLVLVAVALLTASLIRLNAPQVFQLGWLLELGVTFAASVFLLLGLVAQLSRVDRVLTRIATSDDLTGLTSRAAFISDLDERLANLRPNEQLGLIWLDLDGFKAVNDQQGHDFGDRLLRIVAQRLNDVALPAGTTIGRLGGDEFGITVPAATPEYLWQLSGELITAIRAPINLQQTNIQLSATLGYAIAPHDGATARELAQSSDAAMYAGKKMGRDRALPYRPQMAEAARQSALRRLQLAEAISRRQFRLLYQSILDVQTGELWGSEVLVRWHQSGRMASAAEFVPFAEQTGQIVELGRVVVDLFVADMQTLPPQTANGLRWAINLSPRELEDSRAVASLVEGLPTVLLRQMVVEVTESLAVLPDSPSEQSLNTLRAAGLAIALDDFGTGYSNFSVLERIRPALLKIDRSFIVRAAAGDERARTFVNATTAIGHSIGAAVVAEGVEGPRELNFVRAAGIDYAQGYHLSLPCPLDVLVATSLSRATSAS